MTGYWKTDHVCTFGQLLFIGPANGHTHTLPVHCCMNGLGWLVCFSRAGFADHVGSRLRRWGPWGHWMVGCLLGPSGLVWACGWRFLGSWLLRWSCWGVWPASGFPPPPLRPPPPRPAPSAHPLRPPIIRAIHDITVVVKKVAQNPAVLASVSRNVNCDNIVDFPKFSHIL